MDDDPARGARVVLLQVLHQAAPADCRERARQGDACARQRGGARIRGNGSAHVRERVGGVSTPPGRAPRGHNGTLVTGPPPGSTTTEEHQLPLDRAEAQKQEGKLEEQLGGPQMRLHVLSQGLRHRGSATGANSYILEVSLKDHRISL